MIILESDAYTRIMQKEAKSSGTDQESDLEVNIVLISMPGIILMLNLRAASRASGIPENVS